MYKLFQGIPTKPILVIAPLILFVSLGLYYQGQYKRCTEQANLREQLYSHLQKSVAQTIPLADVMPFAWDQAFVLQNYKPDRKIRGCPFGWDWTEEQRNKLIDQNLLTIIFFTLNKKRVTFVEFNNQNISFDSVEKEISLTAESAYFEVELKDEDSTGLLLRRVGS